MNNDSFHIQGIGLVKFEKSQRARRVNISVKPGKPVRVAVPRGVSFEQALRFLHTKKDWLKKARKRIESHQEKIENQRTVFDENSRFSTRNHQLKLIPTQRNNIRLEITNSEIFVFFPEKEPVTNPAIQEAAQKGIAEAMRIEAKTYLPRRLRHLAQKHHLRYRKIGIRNARTRWGSCSGQNNINLSLHLMRLPDHLIDYVLLHELAHTKEKNHSKAFWAFLEKICPNSKRLDKELKKYNIDVF